MKTDIPPKESRNAQRETESRQGSRDSTARPFVISTIPKTAPLSRTGSFSIPIKASKTLKTTLKNTIVPPTLSMLIKASEIADVSPVLLAEMNCVPFDPLEDKPTPIVSMREGTYSEMKKMSA